MIESPNFSVNKISLLRCSNSLTKKNHFEKLESEEAFKIISSHSSHKERNSTTNSL